MTKNTFYAGLAFFGVVVALLLPRLPALDRYVTPDEPKWMMRSANFYHALTNFDLKSTYQHEHPGVTVTWAGMAGFIRRYPQYVNTRTGQIERAEKLFIFLRNHQIPLMSILATGRLFMVIFITATVALSFLVASRLLGLVSAFLGFILIAFDPFFTALSRLLHVDGLMSALMLLSLFSYLGYLYNGRKLYFLLISGISAGLGWLTKSPALFLLPFIGLVALIDLVSKVREQNRKDRPLSQEMARLVWRAFAPSLGWFAIASATFFILWPAMWVNPLNTLKLIFSQAAVYALEGHENITFFNGQIYDIGDSAWYFYPISFLWRTTPPVLIGFGLAVLALIFHQRLGIPAKKRSVVLYLVLFAVLFTVSMSLGDKKFDRYLLPAHLACDLIAAFGWVMLAETLTSRLADRFSERFRRFSLIALYGALIAFQLSGVLQTYPYYLNYYNPLLGGIGKAVDVMMVGWGEGLDLAADYLNEQPSAEKLRVISWYGDGPLSFFFKGQTVGMDVDMSLEFLQKSDYIVLYINQIPRQLPSQEILSYFETLTPLHVVKIDNLDYARIYKMQDIPDLPP
jgi:hypothetical protein